MPVALFHLLQVGELEDALHRAKDLLLGDAHVVGHSRENRRLDEEASISLTAATGLQGGPLPLAGLDEAKDLVPLDAVNSFGRGWKKVRRGRSQPFDGIQFKRSF